MSALVSMKFQGSDARNPLGVRGKNHGGWERLSALVSMKFQGATPGILLASVAKITEGGRG